MARYWFSVFVCIALLAGLAGCSIDQQAGGGGALEAVSREVMRAVSPTPETPPLTGAKGSQVRLPLVARQKPLATEPAPSPIAPAQPTAMVKPFQICSPLANQGLDELGEIVSDPYHPPPAGKEERHHGVDFAYYWRDGRASIEGEGVQSVFAGIVAAAVINRFPYGNVVIVETPGSGLPADLSAALQIPEGYSLYVLYAHMREAPEVDLNAAVDACQPLGAVGRSGNAGGVHLHLEMRIGPPRQRFESLAYYKADATPEERESYLRWRVSGEFQHLDPMIVLNAP